MKFSLARILVLLQAFAVCASASNTVVNLSHYDLMQPDFAAMRREGIVAVIHESSFPRFERDTKYAERQGAATAAGLLWGAYHFADATDPQRQADHFLETVRASWRRASPAERPRQILLVLDFEKNTHYRGGTMRVDQAVAFIQRIHERTGRYPGFYGSEYRLRQVLSGPGVTAEQKRAIAQCWLWVANYHYEPKAMVPFGAWRMWQYTGDGVCDLPRGDFPKGVANIRHAERNMFLGDVPALRAFWELHGWQPES